MKTPLVMILAATVLGSCNTPSKEAPEPAAPVNGTVTTPDSSTATPGIQQHDAHDTSTWEGAPNDSGR